MCNIDLLYLYLDTIVIVFVICIGYVLATGDHRY